MKLLNKILKVLNDKQSVATKKSKLNIYPYNAKEWMKVVLSDQSTFSRVKHQMLNQDGKVLYYIVYQFLYPKGASISNVSGFESFIMWAIENGYELNLDHIIMHHLMSRPNFNQS